MNVKLLKSLRNTARNKIGVFRFSNGKYHTIFNRSFLTSLSDFDEKSWKQYGEDSGYQVFEGCENLKDAIAMCNYYRREFILRELRRMKGNVDRYY